MLDDNALMGVLKDSGFHDRIDPSRTEASEAVWEQLNLFYDLLHIGAKTARGKFTHDDVAFIVSLYDGIENEKIDWIFVVRLPAEVSGGVRLEGETDEREHSPDIVEKVVALTILERFAFADAIGRFWAHPSVQSLTDLDAFWFDNEQRNATDTLAHISTEMLGA